MFPAPTILEELRLWALAFLLFAGIAAALLAGLALAYIVVSARLRLRLRPLAYGRLLLGAKPPRLA